MAQEKLYYFYWTFKSNKLNTMTTPETSSWKMLISVENEMKALPYFVILEENEIPYNTLNKKDSEFFIGEIEIYVNEEYFQEAELLINKIN